MKINDSLIHTKLHPPFTRSDLVSRPRLQEQVAQGFCSPLTLITAPAGFGKTILAATGVATVEFPVAWLSLDRDDNQAGRFLNYLVAALQEADNSIGNEATQLTGGTQSVPPEAILISIINDLDIAGKEIALVLDDYQFINNHTVHEAVAFLLDHCPNSFHLLIASRSDPPLPLARLRARGQMVELRAADLRFTVPEATQFLNEVMGLRLDASSVEKLEERTEGWIAGLQMAALSMQGREDVDSFIRAFAGTHRFIMDFMLEEVLAREPEDVQNFLLQTAILSRFTGPLCDAVTDTAGGQKVLKELEKRNIFVVALDDERQWFRYHHLFADLLQARLQQDESFSAPNLHIRAAAWLEQNGLIPEAIQHFFAASEIDRAADLIERYGPEHWSENDLSVMQLAEGLPSETLIARPKISLYWTWLLITQGYIERAVPLLRELAQQLASAESDSRLRWMQTMIALMRAFLSGSTPLPDYQRLNEIPVSEPIMFDAAEVIYGMALGRRGEIDRAVEVSVKSIQRKKLQYETPIIPQLVPFLARLYLMQGRLGAADSLCREYLDPFLVKGIRFNDSAGGMQVVQGEILYERNRLDEAEKYIQDGLQASEPWQNIMADAFGLLALIRVLQAKREYVRVMQIVEKFETRLQNQSRPFEFTEEFRTLRIRVQLASGDLKNASQWAEQIQNSESFHHHKEPYQLTLARIRLSQGRHAEVEEILTGNVPSISAGNRIARQIEANLLMASAIANQERMPDALSLIESCLALAEPEGYIRTFLDIGNPARELLAAYLKSDAPSGKLYAQKVLEAFSSSSEFDSPGPQPEGLIEPLTERELEVLHLIALGKTNQEIAEHLVVARGTIKAHAASIYRKLDVANRTEAVARARQLDILP